MLKSIYLQQVYSDLTARDPEQKEFHQAVREVLESLDLMIDSHPEYREAALLERFVEPERVVAFRVPWMDDTGRIRVNRGYRVQFNSAIGPYKGGLRFHPEISGLRANFEEQPHRLAHGRRQGRLRLRPQG